MYVLPCFSFIHVYPSVRATSDLIFALHLKVGDDLNYRAYIARSTGPATDIPPSSDTIKFEILISRPTAPFSFAMVILLWSRRSPRKTKLKSNKLTFRHIYTRVSPITFESYRMCVEVKDELQAKEVARHSGHRPTKKMSARGNYQQLKLETRVNMKSPSAERARSRQQRDITLTYYSNISVTNVYLTSISFRSASRGEKKKIITLCP